MKVTKKYIEKLIKEELENVLNEVEVQDTRMIFFPKASSSKHSEIDPSRHMLAIGKKQMRGDEEVVPYAAYDVKAALQKVGEGSRDATDINAVLKNLGTGKAQVGYNKPVMDNSSNVRRGESYVLTREDFEEMGANPGVTDYAFRDSIYNR